MNFLWALEFMVCNFGETVSCGDDHLGLQGLQGLQKMGQITNAMSDTYRKKG